MPFIGNYRKLINNDVGQPSLLSLFGEGNYYDWDAQNSLINPKQAADFNGTNQSLQTASTDFDKGDEDFSMGCWVKFDSTASCGVMGKWDQAGNQRSYLIYINGSAQLSVALSVDGNPGSSVQQVSVSTGTWYFAVFVYDSVNDVLKMSVDGDHFYTVSHTGGAFASTADFYFGLYNPSVPVRLNGQTDEAFFIDRALNIAEVNAIYNSGNGVTYPTFTDGVSLNNVDYAVGKWFDETDDGYNIDSLVTPLASTTTGAWSFWYKPDDVTPAANSRFIAFGDTDASEFVNMYIIPTGEVGGALSVAGTIQWNLRTNSTTPLTVGVWHHMVFVQDGVNLSLYINGVAQDLNMITTTDTSAWFNDVSGVDNGRIGILNFNSLGDTGFINGTIDEVAIYDNALTYSEVQDLYNSGSGLGYDSLSTATGSGANAFNFDGTDDALNSDVLITPTASDTAGTWCAWIKITDATPTGFNTLFNFGDANGNAVIYGGVVATTGVFQIFARTTASAQWRVDTDAQAFTSGTWHHVAIVQTADSNAPKIYIDAVEVAQTNVTSIDNSFWFSATGALDTGRIGCLNYNSGGNTSFWDGDVDEVMVYSTDLSSAEVSAIYNSGSGVTYDDLSAAQKTNLVAYYTCENHNDSHTGNYHLGSVDSPKPVAGKVEEHTSDLTTDLVAYWELDGDCNTTESDRVSSLAATPIDIPASAIGKINDTTTSAIETSLVSWWEFDSDANITVDAHGTNTLTNNGSTVTVDGQVIGSIDNNDNVFRINDGGTNDKDFEALDYADRPLYVTSGVNGLPSLDFDGASEWMQHNSLSAFKFLHDGTVSYAGFVTFNLVSTGTTQVILTTRFSSAGVGMILSVNSSGNVLFQISNASGNIIDITSTNTITWGADSYVIFGFDASLDRGELYVNDIFTLDTNTASGAHSTADHAEELTLGARETGGAPSLFIEQYLGQLAIGTGKSAVQARGDLKSIISSNWGL